MSAGLGLILLILLLAANAALNGIEIAVIAANKVRVRHLAESGSRRAQSLVRVHQHQDDFLATIVFLVTFTVAVSGFLGPTISEDLFGGTSLVQTLLSFLLVTYVTATVGDLTPKVLGVRASTSFALLVAPVAEGMMRVLGPFVTALGLLPRFLTRRIFGVDLQSGLSVSEAELRMYIDISAESGSVAEAEAELLDRVFHFGDRRVHEVMVPRTEVVWLEHDAIVRDFYKVFQKHPHSRFPVFEGNQDAILGIVGIKDVMRGLSTGQMNETSAVESVMRPAYFVPETKLVGELFREMQANRSQMAVAVDEFGGTAGIVTLEQLLEEMVGSVGDELHPPETEIQPIDESTVQVEGTLSIAEAREELGIDIPEGEYDTIAGYVLSILGRIPQEGESVPLAGHRVTIVEMKGPKIELLRVTRA